MDQPLFIRHCTRGVKICCSFKRGVVYEPKGNSRRIGGLVPSLLEESGGQGKTPGAEWNIVWED